MLQVYTIGYTRAHISDICALCDAGAVDLMMTLGAARVGNRTSHLSIVPRVAPPNVWPYLPAPALLDIISINPASHVP